MAESSGFFADVSGDREYTSDWLAKYISSIVGNGTYDGELGVTADGSAMSVTLPSGRAWINGYYYCNDGNLTLAIDNADGVLNRKDIAVLRWDVNARSIAAQVIKGAQASTAVAPSITRTAEQYDLKLAEISVPAGTTAITQSMITDCRLDKSVCGIVTGAITQVDTTTFYNQIAANLAEFKGTNEAEFTTWKNAKYTEFQSWLSTMQNIPPADAAAYLQGQINSRAYSKLDCKKTGTVYALSGLTVASGLVPCVFKADADYNFGDTFTMDGDAITVALPDGSGLEDGFFKAGTVLTGVYDTDSKTLNFKSGGSDYDTLPAQVSNFYAARYNAKVTLNWTNPGDTNFAGVLILRKTGGYPQRPSDGDRVYSGTGTTYTDTGLTNGTQYYYRAFAYNAKKQYQTLYCVTTGTPVEYVESGTLPVGAMIGINENSQEVPYIIVHQGLPSTKYDSSCDGTWLLRKDLIQLSSNINNQSDAALIVHKLDDKINQLIKTVTIPVDTAQTNSVKVFALSPQEVGVNEYFYGNAGSKLDYFLSGYDDSASTSKRMAKFNGNASAWWGRGSYGDHYQYYYIDASGKPASVDVMWASHIYSRPAFIIDRSTQMTSGPDENGCYKVL